MGATVAEFKSGKFEFRCDKQGIVHVPFGKLSFPEAVRSATPYRQRDLPTPSPQKPQAMSKSPNRPRRSVARARAAERTRPANLCPASQDLLSNLKAVQETVDKNKPTGAKGRFWTSMYICSSMGPSLKIDIDALNKMTPVAA